MFNLILLLIIKINQTYAITYDQGYFGSFDYTIDPNFACQGDVNYISIIQFSAQFDNPPQVILISEKTDVHRSNQKYEISIQDTTTISFTIKIYCQYTRVYAVNFRWFAIDDQRVEVFNIADLTNITIPHQNPNALYGFISLISIGFQGAIDFKIYIPNVTPEQVSVNITNPSNLHINLLSINYQIVLAPQELLTFFGNINQPGNYVSGPITIVDNSWFLTPRYKYDYTNIKNIRLNVTYISFNPIEYEYFFWDTDTPNAHQQIWMLYTPTKEYLALKGGHVRISKTYCLLILNSQILQLTIQETNTQYIPNGQYKQILPNNKNQINFIIQGKCSKNKKYIAKFLFCPECPIETQYKIFSHNCYGAMNKIMYSVRFEQQIDAYEKIIIEKSDVFLKVQQLLYNQILSTVTLIDIQIENI